jgi:predicted DsbA family dithiol-disulfide isomerase
MALPSPRRAGLADPAPTKHFRIDVWSDLVCPWCYIGQHRLSKAIASSPYAEVISVVPRSFELDPGRPVEPVLTLDMIAQKFGVPASQAERIEERMAALAHSDGLEYSPQHLIANTFNTHRLVQLAATHGLGNQLLDLLQRELFTGRPNIFEHSFLAGAAAQLGITRQRAEAVLNGDEYGDAVRRDEQDARSLGITGVPFTLIGGRLAIAGARSIEDYTQAIEQAWGG